MSATNPTIYKEICNEMSCMEESWDGVIENWIIDPFCLSDYCMTAFPWTWEHLELKQRGPTNFFSTSEINLVLFL